MSERCPVLCLGLTPAWQRTLVFERLETGEVNRARQTMESAAGKSVNTARALVTLGTPALAAGFNGGATGRRLASHLTACGVGVGGLTPMRAATRICTTLIDRQTGAVTELVEEAPTPGASSIARFVRDNLKQVRQAPMLIISGTLPPFVGDDFYVRFVRAASDSDVPVVIDSHRNALVQTLSERPLLAKLTVRELEVTLGVALPSEARLLRGMRTLLEKGARHVLVTQGARAAYLLAPGGAWRFAPPPITRLLNPIGSGDCATAGIAHALLRGAALREAVRWGLACGSANAESLTPAEIDLCRVRALRRAVSRPVRAGK